MRILVTGGQGQVGSAFAELGSPFGLDLICLGRDELDITDEKSISNAFRQYQPELLINAAAYTNVDKAESEPNQAFCVNERGVALLADACLQFDIPAFHISTDYVFDGTKKGLYREEDSVNPLAIYAKSKEAGEQILRLGLKRHLILRTSWVFGNQGNNFVKTMIHLSKSRDNLSVVSDQYGGPSSARQIAEILLEIANQYKQLGVIPWGTYHFCQKPYVSWYQFAKEIISKSISEGIVGHPVQIQPIASVDYKTVVTRPLNSRLDTNKLKQNFGIVDSSWSKDLDMVVKSIR